jgi:hypothetical protein
LTFSSVSAQRLGELPADPEPHQRQRVVHALAQRAGGIRPRLVELGGEQLKALLGQQRIGQ